MEVRIQLIILLIDTRNEPSLQNLLYKECYGRSCYKLGEKERKTTVSVRLTSGVVHDVETSDYSYYRDTWVYTFI